MGSVNNACTLCKPCFIFCGVVCECVGGSQRGAGSERRSRQPDVLPATHHTNMEQNMIDLQFLYFALQEKQAQHAARPTRDLEIDIRMIKGTIWKIMN